MLQLLNCFLSISKFLQNFQKRGNFHFETEFMSS